MSIINNVESRNSMATIMDTVSIHTYAGDKMTPLPTTPLPTPIRNMLNNISALNNRNYTTDTVPNTPAAFSTPLPIPVVSLPPLPLPMSKSPVTSTIYSNSTNYTSNMTSSTTTTTTNSTYAKASVQHARAGAAANMKSSDHHNMVNQNMKPVPHVKSPVNSSSSKPQEKSKSPLKIGHTSLKQVSYLFWSFFETKSEIIQFRVQTN